MADAALEVAELAAAECWDGYGVHDDSRGSQGSVVPVRWVCEDDGNQGSRIRDEAADPWRDGYDVHGDSRSSQGSVVLERARDTDGSSGSRIPDEAAGPFAAVLAVLVLAVLEPEPAELVAPGVEPLRR